MDITKILGGVAAFIAIVTFTVKMVRKCWRDREKSRPIHPHVAGGSVENETDEQRQARHEREMIESNDPEIWKPLR